MANMLQTFFIYETHLRQGQSYYLPGNNLKKLDIFAAITHVSWAIQMLTENKAKKMFC